MISEQWSKGILMAMMELSQDVIKQKASYSSTNMGRDVFRREAKQPVLVMCVDPHEALPDARLTSRKIRRIQHASSDI